MDVLQSVLAFVVAIGLLVAFHEFGHYWVAKRLGVKVLRYSIGFGKVLISWRGGRDDTEYAISAIPLGGYVKMLDEREGEVPDNERHRAFNRQSVAVRTAIVAAGPVFNFLFAIAAYWLVFIAGSTVIKPVIGEVLSESPAAEAGFQAGDELLRIGGDDVSSWEEALMVLLDAGVAREAVPVTVRTEAGVTEHRVLPLQEVRVLGDNQDFLGVVGVRPWTPKLPPIVGQVEPGMPAAEVGLAPGERIVAIDGAAIEDWSEVVAAVSGRPGEVVTLRLDSNGGERTVRVTLAAREVRGEQVGMLGIAPEVPEGLYAGVTQEVRYGPLAAVPEAVEATWQASVLTLRVLWQMLLGEASLKHLSGPVSIAQYAGESAGLGWLQFVKFLAIVSISLGVLNLLPVPVLDGGHLLYYGVEAVRGRPLSEHAQMLGQQVGMALLGLLMVVAFYNDITRLLG